jgi:uncharacterized membrane protein YsdA (DUF1294 family)
VQLFCFSNVISKRGSAVTAVQFQAFCFRFSSPVYSSEGSVTLFLAYVSVYATMIDRVPSSESGELTRDPLSMKFPGVKKIWLTLCASWFIGSVAILVASLSAISFKAGLWAEVYCLAVGFLSPVAFCVYGWDKWKAEREGRRVSEKTLHLLAIAGGWPGAVAGQQWFRHKTLKPFFRTVLLLTAVLHVTFVATCFFL